MAKRPAQSDPQTKLNTYHAVRKLKQEQKLSDEAAIAYFIGRGVRRETAEANLALYYNVERQRLNRNARRDIIGGMMILASGVVIAMVYPSFQNLPLLVRGLMPAAGLGLMLFGLYRQIRAGRLPRF